MLRPADWYFCRSAAVSGVLELLNMLARFCRLMFCPSLALPCMLANGDGLPGACAITVRHSDACQMGCHVPNCMGSSQVPEPISVKSSTQFDYTAERHS